MLAPAAVTLGKKVVLLDRSTGKIEERQWFVNGELKSNSRDFEYRFDTPDPGTVELLVKGPGWQSSKKLRIEVIKPVPPSVNIVGPDEARFGSKIKLAGLIEDSEAPIEKIVWYVNDAVVSDNLDRELSLECSQAKDQEIRVLVKTAFGSTESKRTVRVVLPPKPVVNFFLPESALVGESVVVLDRCTGDITQTRWYDDGNLIDADRDLVYVFQTAGEHQIRLEAIGLGGTSAKTAVIHVKPIPQPDASFAVGMKSPRVGDEVIITDVSTASEVATWYISDLSPIVRNYRLGEPRTIAFKPHEAGTTNIRLVASGAGGQSELSQKITVLPRNVPPQSFVRKQQIINEDGSATVRFLVSAVGIVERLDVDFGDGTNEIALDNGHLEFEHTFSPGVSLTKIQVVGAAEFSPEFHELLIDVPRPWPAWLRQLWWGIPVGFVALIGGVLSSRWRAARQRRWLDSLVDGVFKYKPAGSPGPYQEQAFFGENKEEQVFFENGQQAVLRNVFNQLTGMREIRVELRGEDGALLERVDLSANERVSAAGYEFYFAPNQPL